MLAAVSQTVLSRNLCKHLNIFLPERKCHSIVFGLRDLIQQEKLSNVTIKPITIEHHAEAVGLIKNYYLKEHVLVQARHMDLGGDRALDEYLVTLLRQGNSIYATTNEGDLAGFCVNFASSPVDPNNLRNYAFYRQNPNTKDFLHFTAILQETPNLWKAFTVPKIFEIKMLAVIPQYRRQGIAVMLTERAQELAKDQGYGVVRMDCVNQYDYKIAERCMLQCIAKYPLHKLRGANAPFIKRTSEHNRCLRVYVATNLQSDAPDRSLIKSKQGDIDNQLCD